MSPADPIRILVVDDEPVARDGVRRMLEGADGVAEVRACASATEALRELRASDFDLMLVDVQMPGMSGLELVEAFGQDRAPVVVFLTAYDQYAIQAFESGAVDYLLKPFSDERFARALERARRQIAQRRLAAEAGVGGEAAPHGRLDKLLVRTVGTITFVRAEEIDWIEAADYYAVVHTAGKEHLVRITMRRLERSLDPRAFVRIHRNAIVRIDRIRELRQDAVNGLEVELQDGTRLAVSRRLRERLRERVLRD